MGFLHAEGHSSSPHYQASVGIELTAAGRQDGPPWPFLGARGPATMADAEDGPLAVLCRGPGKLTATRGVLSLSKWQVGVPSWGLT